MKKAMSVLISIILVCSINAFCQEEVSRIREFNLTDEAVASEGYDVVSYFMSEAQKGIKTISYRYNGVKYYFSNNENLEVFKKQPDKFEPAYGGWCAFAMGDSGEKVKIDPKTYKIIDGKLYLFYNFYFNNTLIDWNKDEENLKAKADANWLKFIAK